MHTVQLCQCQQTVHLPTHLGISPARKSPKGKAVVVCSVLSERVTRAGKPASLHSSDKQVIADLDLSSPLYTRVRDASTGMDLCALHVSLISSIFERAREAAGAGNSFTHSILIDSCVFVRSLSAAFLLF